MVVVYIGEDLVRIDDANIDGVPLLGTPLPFVTKKWIPHHILVTWHNVS